MNAIKHVCGQFACVIITTYYFLLRVSATLDHFQGDPSTYKKKRDIKIFLHLQIMLPCAAHLKFLTPRTAVLTGVFVGVFCSFDAIACAVSVADIRSY